IRRRRASGGVTIDDFRAITAGLWSGLAAIHAQGVIHGDIKPGKIIISTSDGRAVIHRFWSAQRAEVVASRPTDAPLDGGTLVYMSPERWRSGGASLAGDVYAMALTLWEMCTCRVPEMGYRPRERPMKEQILSDEPTSSLTR